MKTLWKYLDFMSEGPSLSFPSELEWIVLNNSVGSGSVS